MVGVLLQLADDPTLKVKLVMASKALHWYLIILNTLFSSLFVKITYLLIFYLRPFRRYNWFNIFKTMLFPLELGLHC